MSDKFKYLLIILVSGFLLNVNTAFSQTAAGFLTSRNLQGGKTLATRNFNNLGKRNDLSSETNSSKSENFDESLASPGELDPTFGPVGFVITSLAGIDRAFAIARQADGKIILAGTRNASDSSSNIGLVRYNPNGSLDTTFDGDGIVTTQIGTTGTEASAVAVQPDGKIVVAGIASNSGTGFYTIVRYNPNGSLDTSFDGDGIFTISGVGRPDSMAIQPDGKIVTAGSISLDFFTSDFCIVRVNPNGGLDTTFDNDGKAIVSVSDPGAGNADLAYALALQADGKIVVGGESDFLNTARDFTLARLNTDGSLDTTFDGDGKVRTSFGGNNQNDGIASIAIKPDGKIVAAGYGGEDAVRGFAIAQYNSDGSLDASFGGDGKLVAPTSNNGVERAYGVAVQPDGKIVAVGYSIVKLSVIRLNLDGSPDQAFGNNGIVLSPINSSGSAVARAVLIDPNGKIAVAGSAVRGGTIEEDFVLARYNSDGTPETSLGVFGYVVTNPFNQTDQSSDGRSIAMQADKKIVVGGNRYITETVTVGMIARYTTEGRLDSSFASATDGFGFATVNVPGALTQELNGVVIQPDGKILGVGTYEDQADVGLYVVQYNTDGLRNTSFGGSGNGFAKIASADGGGLGQAIAVQPDGKILVGGAIPNFVSQTVDFAVYRFNADGSRDNSFGASGVASIDLSTGNDIPFSIALQTDGKIVLSGSANFGENTDGNMALVRFNANGSLDNAFGSGGKVITALSNFPDIISDIQLQTDGKIVAAGTKCSDLPCSSGTGAILRYNTNGSPDNSFDGDGVVFVQTPGSLANGLSSVEIQPNGKIVAAGVTVNPATQSDALVVRYESSGLPDSNFGSGGIITSDISALQQEAFSVALQADGKIVTAGYSASNSRADVTVWRYLGDARPASGRAVFDFDGDGKTDISIFRPASGEWWLNRSSTGATVAAQFGLSTDKPAPADFTGDGKTDVAFFRPSSGEWFILRSEDSSFLSFTFGANGDVPVVGDFDADGKADPGVFRPASNEWFILKSSGGVIITTFGTAGDIPVTADYDGDGKTDIAIYRANSGEWWISRSSNASVYAFQFGTSTDKPVQGDYSGDGKADVAIFRPSTGYWFILRSEDSSFYSVPFGANGDIPAPGDYDGDGKFDTAVFRPNGSTWYVQRSTAGTLITTFGIAGDRPIPGVFVP
jgi:uncharacterized delta-60 repeat protein